MVVLFLAAIGGASVFGPPRFNDADVGAAKELRLRGSRFSCLRRVVVGLLLLLVEVEEVEDEAEEVESHVVAPPLFCSCCLLLDDDCSIFSVINISNLGCWFIYLLYIIYTTLIVNCQ